MSASPRVLILSFLIGWVILASPASYALPQESGDLSAKLRAIEDRIKKVEEGQKQITEKEENILTEIANLRVWIKANC